MSVYNVQLQRLQYLGSELCDGLGGPQHSPAAAHVELHQLDHGARPALQVVASAINSTYIQYQYQQ